MSNYAVFDDDLDLHDTLLTVDELISKYKTLYKTHQIYWNPDTVKTRAWSFILYPDSAPENWLDILNDRHVPFCISPFHDKDVKADGSPKKGHYHVLYISDGPAYFKSCLAFMHMVGGVRLEPVHSLRGSVRYHLHLDDPKKFPYKQEDMICLAGFDPSEFLAISDIQMEDVSRSMTEYVLSHGIGEYRDFASVCLNRNRYWYKILTEHHPRHFQFLINSLRHSGNFSFITFLCFIKPLVSAEFYEQLEDLYSTFMSERIAESVGEPIKLNTSKKEVPDE